MLGQTVPPVARAYDRQQRLERGAAIAAVLRQWRRMGDDFGPSFLTIAPALIEIVNFAQDKTATLAAGYIPDVLAATGQARADVPRWEINPRQWVGTAGSGIATEEVLYGAVIEAKTAVKAGATTAQALNGAGQWLSATVGTILADTQRGAEGAGTYSRRVSGYVRALQPPSCGRCVILAGRWYRKNAGFDRHPGCDCYGIPAAEDVAGDWTTDPTTYLNSLDEQGLAKVLGSKDNARVWLEFGQERPQATMNQLVNAYRKSGGIRKAQLYDRTVKYTLEGTTRRGVAFHQMSQVRQLVLQGEVKDGRYRRLNAPRLMPSSIFQIATNQAHAERLLRDHGWLGIS